MNGLQIIEAAKAKRQLAGLKLVWIVLAQDGQREFVAYAKDAAQKARWIAGGKAKGWELIEEVV